MTLIEVVAGLALLSTLLVSLLEVKAHLGRQTRETQRRRAAIAAADALLSAWWQHPQTFARSAIGVTDGPAGETFAWRTAVLTPAANPLAAASTPSLMPGEIIRLTVDGDVSVDVLLPPSRGIAAGMAAGASP